MTPRPLSESLNVLIATAEHVIGRPQLLPQRLPDSFAELAAGIRHADARPAEDARATPAALVMLIAIEQFYASDREVSSPWLMLAGATLPMLRTAAWVALNNEKRARGQS